jgi:methylglyoxal synthase
MHEPDQRTMSRIAEALGLPVAYFHATSDPLAKIILLVSRMPEDQQEEVLGMIRKWKDDFP